MKKLISVILGILSALPLFSADPKISFSWDANTKAIESTASFTSSDGYFTISSLGSTNPSNRNKEGYTKGIKVSSVEIDMTSFNSGAGFPIGSIAFVMQNGSSGNTMDITVSYYDGSAWIETEKTTVGGNASTTYYPATIVSKANVKKVKFAFTNSSWFLAVNVFESTATDGVPALVTAAPAENAFLSGDGTITLQFDELVKAGTGNITLGSTTISNVAYKGNTVEISYTGFAAAASLSVPAGAITDLAGNSLSSDLSIAYQKDVTPPTQTAIVPAENSDIHVSDLGEDSRKIKITFDEKIKIGTGEITFGSGTIFGTITATVDENTLTISYSGLPYDKICELIIPDGYITDLSGNSWAGKTFSFTTGSRDTTPPVFLGTSVGSNEKLPVSGSITFTFDEIVVLGDAQATVNGQPATLSNNGKAIGLNYTALPYDNGISIQIPAGCITDTCGNAYAGDHFDFLIKSKESKAFDVVVASDGSGDYATIQAAIDAITDESQRSLIYVKAGTYNEKLCVWKDNVSLIGEDADKVFILWNECASTSTLPSTSYGTGITNVGTDASFTMLITGDNFYGENFTVRNDYDYATGTEANKQAVALEHKDGDKHVLKNVKMYSFQDTYYPKSANKRHYLTDCYILGGTDFIFGSGTAFIDNSEIYCYPGGQYITAASDTQKEFGIVVSNSEIKYGGMEAIGTKRQFYLGRPWKAPAKTAFVNNTFESGLIQNAGWSIWSGTENHLTTTYAEYGNTLLDGNAVDVSGRADWSIQLTAKEAARFNPDNAFNYGANNAWNPLAFSTAPTAVTTATVDDAGNITWTELDYAVGYLIFKGDNLLASATSDSYSDLTYTDGDIYKIAAYNEYGATSEKTVVGTSTGISNINDGAGFLTSTLVADYLSLQNAEELLSMEIFNLNGQKVFSTYSVSSEISVSGLQAGFYFVIGQSKDGRKYIDKIVKE